MTRWWGGGPGGGILDMGMGFQSGMGSRHGDGVPDIGMGFQTQEKPKFPLPVEGTFGDDI